MGYPKEIRYESPLRHFHPGMAPELIQKVVEQTKMFMIDENIIQILYPEDLVEDIHTVNVDNYTYRLDFKYKNEQCVLWECYFPEVPWNRENFFKNKRFANGKRIEMPGNLVIEYPKLS